MAYKLGDHTAKYQGRLTLNPIAHLDPVGALMILFVGFGWAKPVPVSPVNFKNPRLDMMKVAFAGPASNLVLAFVAGLGIRFLNTLHLPISESFSLIIYFVAYINIALAMFNLIPVAPLDGSQIFGGFISKNNPELAWKMQMYGPKVLLGIILIGYLTPFSLIGTVLHPLISIFMYIFAGIQ
jgi:Zn-dependent protease